MSSAISLVKPLAKSIRPCPYCDHISPADSKFCGACGAALHLVPCPQCGAVNDITATTACYRCHSELHEKSADALPALVEPETAEPAPPSRVASESPGRQRPHGLVVLIVLLAFAAASYYAFRQRGSLEPGEPAPAAAEVKGRVSPAAESSPAGAATAKPVSPAKSGTTDAAAISPVPEKSAVVPPVATVSTNDPANARGAASPAKAPATAAAPAVPANNARNRTDASKGLETPSPNIGPCTDAVAALGLCTAESTQKR